MTHRHLTHNFAEYGTDNKAVSEALTTNSYSDNTFIVGLTKTDTMTVYLLNSNQGGDSAGLHYRVDVSPGKFYNESTEAVEHYWIEDVAETALTAGSTFIVNNVYDDIGVSAEPWIINIRIQIKSAVADTPSKFRLYVTSKGTH